MSEKNLLETKNGLTGIGSPAFLNINYGSAKVPLPNDKFISVQMEFDEIKSHYGDATDDDQTS
jgi:hypothetical protein